MKNVRHAIVTLIVALSLAVGATSAAAAPDRWPPVLEPTPDGITWQ
jgi:hypothetical protein